MSFTRQYNHEFTKLYRFCSPLKHSCWSPSVLKIMNIHFFQALCFISIISFCLSRFYLGFLERHGLVWSFLIKERGEQWPLPQSLCVACFIFPKSSIYSIKKSENPKLRLCWHSQCQNCCGDSLNDLWMTVSYKSTSLPVALTVNQSKLSCFSPAGFTRSGGALCQCSSCHPQTAVIIKSCWTGCLQVTSESHWSSLCVAAGPGDSRAPVALPNPAQVRHNRCCTKPGWISPSKPPLASCRVTWMWLHPSAQHLWNRALPKVGEKPKAAAGQASVVRKGWHCFAVLSCREHLSHGIALLTAANRAWITQHFCSRCKVLHSPWPPSSVIV